MVIANLYRENHTKKHSHTHSEKEKKEIYIYKEGSEQPKSINKSTKDNKL